MVDKPGEEEQVVSRSKCPWNKEQDFIDSLKTECETDVGFSAYVALLNRFLLWAYKAKEQN